MLSVIALVVVVGLVYAQQPPCCTGKQWEANEFYQLGTVEGGQARYMEAFINIAYNEDKQMINRLVDEREGGAEKTFQLLEDFNQKVAYEIVSVNCTKYVINTPFPRACMPVNSTPAQYPMLFGSQAKPLETIVYKIPELEGQNGYITISPDDCTPVMENLEGSIKGTMDLIFKGYSNFTNGIKDPSVFNVPPQCESVQVINSFENELKFYNLEAWFDCRNTIQRPSATFQESDCTKYFYANSKIARPDIVQAASFLTFQGQDLATWRHFTLGFGIPIAVLLGFWDPRLFGYGIWETRSKKEDF